MSLLRRRKHEDPSSTDLNPDSSSSKNDEGEEVLVPISELKAVARKGRKRRTWSIFALGGLFGLLLAALFASKNDMIPLAAISEFADQHWENFSSVLPAGFLKDAKDLSVSLGELSFLDC